MAKSLADLQFRFQIPGLTFDNEQRGLIRARFSDLMVTGEVYLHGAHCTAWQPAGQSPVLWMSAESYFEDGKPIRGGVPICFPWFGSHPTNKDAPGHGTARIKSWDLQSVVIKDSGGVRLEFSTDVAPFEVRYAVAFGQRLTLELKVTVPKTHSQSERYEDALHTYLSISDIRQVSISGLERIDYIDKVGQVTQRPATGQPITFEGETDRVYVGTVDTCTLHDPGLNRKIVVRKSGSRSTVIWNPWIAKSARMPDFGDNEWPGMVCIETANVGEQAITLAPGQSHTTTAEISVE